MNLKTIEELAALALRNPNYLIGKMVDIAKPHVGDLELEGLLLLVEARLAELREREV